MSLTREQVNKMRLEKLQAAKPELLKIFQQKHEKKTAKKQK